MAVKVVFGSFVSRLRWHIVGFRPTIFRVKAENFFESSAIDRLRITMRRLMRRLHDHHVMQVVMGVAFSQVRGVFQGSSDSCRKVVVTVSLVMSNHSVMGAMIKTVNLPVFIVNGRVMAEGSSAVRYVMIGCGNVHVVSIITVVVRRVVRLVVNRHHVVQCFVRVMMRYVMRSMMRVMVGNMMRLMMGDMMRLMVRNMMRLVMRDMMWLVMRLRQVMRRWGRRWWVVRLKS